MNKKKKRKKPQPPLPVSGQRLGSLVPLAELCSSRPAWVREDIRKPSSDCCRGTDQLPSLVTLWYAE